MTGAPVYLGMGDFEEVLIAEMVFNPELFDVY
jgi:hypothetical protein